MNVVTKKTSELIPYINNPRVHTDAAIDKVASSIHHFGFKVPIVIDTDNEIVAGHTRLKAAKKLGMDEVPCIVADDLNDEQIRAFRLADNRVAEETEWDDELLQVELDNINDYDFSDMGFDEEDIQNFMDEADEDSDSVYTDKIQTPIYEPTEDKPELEELYDLSKADELVSRIEDSDLPSREKEFLKFAAYRHIVFDYHNIAEYYAHSPKNVQELMEDSALVIIDYDKAIESGFIDFVVNVMEEEEGEEEE